MEIATNANRKNSDRISRSLLMSLLIGRNAALNLIFELMTGVKRDDPASFNGNSFSCSRISTWPRCFNPNLEISKSRNFHFCPLNQAL